MKNNLTKYTSVTRDLKKRSLVDSNVKLAFHLHKASASIDVKRQLENFEEHESHRLRREKYRNG